MYQIVNSMKGCRLLIFCLLFLPVLLQAQEIIFSEPVREDSKDMNFDILGRMSGNILVFKNVRWKYALNIYSDSMVLKDKVDFDFLPGKTFNVDCIVYPDFFYLIYQYQKKGILYCMAVKIDANGKKMNDPVQLDTTELGLMGDNKIYSVVNSDDKKKIMIFKIQNKDSKAHFLTKLYDSQLQLQHQTRLQIDYDERYHIFSDFLLDNDGKLVFTNAVKENRRTNPSALSIITKEPLQDSFSVKNIPLQKAYIDEVKLKIDNINKRYILNAFYYKESIGNIEGVYCNIWNAKTDSSDASVFTQFADDLKSNAKSEGKLKTAFNDFYIRNIVLKKDGSFILTAEDYTNQSMGSDNFSRYDYLYGNSFNSYNYYSYTPSYYGFYRPYNSFFNQGTRYYYDNILVLSISKTGVPEWSNIIHKQQYTDDNDNHLSFNIFNTSGEIHFLYNDISKRDKLLSDYIITPDGSSKRSPTLRTYEQGYEFMPRFAKQIGARKVIIPCTFRGQISFAKIDF